MNTRLQELFHLVADLPAGARHRYFAEHQISEEMRREVESLLQSDEAAGDFLEQVIRDEACRSFPQPDPLGIRCGPYRLLKVIGRGGMGVVYLAERADGEVAQRVALKLLPVGAGEGQKERFLQERQILANLAHPNIARFLDAGHLEDGQPYLAMEYVEGESIDVFASRLELLQKIELFLKVCAAVGYLHHNLIVHRDVKPGNILVTAEGEPKLLDFGIAKLLDLRTDTTRTNMRALTPDYASPEQAAGGRLTTTSDIYSLGAVLYRLLTGKPVREFDSHSPAAVASVIATGEVTRPSKWAPELKGDLEVILLKALRRDPRERYGAVEQFSEDLSRYLRNEPIAARSDSVLYRGRKFAMRHRAGLAAALIALLALVAGSGIALSQARQSARERDVALMELRRAEAANDFSSYLLSQATPENGKPISNSELLARGEALIGKRFGKEPDLRIYLLLNLADRYWENQQFAARARVLQQAYNESRSLADAGLRSLAACQWASQLAERGDYKQAVRLFDETLSVLSAGPEYAVAESSCRLYESVAAGIGEDIPRAIHAAERALRLVERPTGVPGRKGDILGALAVAYSGGRRFPDANRAYERAAGILEQEGRENSRDMAVLLNNWSTMLQDAGQMRAAVPISERAIRTVRSADSEHGASPTMLSTYGHALAAVGRYAEAARAFDESLSKALRNGSTRRALRTLNSAIESACESGDTGRARRLLHEEYSILNSQPAKTSYSSGIDLSEARVALAGGDSGRAAAFAGRARSARESVVAEMFLARALNAAGRFHEALASAGKAVSLSMAPSGGFQYSFLTGKALLELADAKRGLGDLEGARKTLDAAGAHTAATSGSESRTAKRARALRQQLTGR